MRPPTHRGLAAFIASRGIDTPQERSDGAFVLVSDDRHRIYMHPASEGSVVLEALVIDLPTDARRADDLLQRTLALAGERMCDWRESLVLTPDERQLQLQWHIAADESATGVGLALEEFLNALGDWRREMGEL